MYRFNGYICINNIYIPWWLSSKESACNTGGAGDAGSIPGSGRHPGEGNGYPLQCSCLKSFMDRGAWRAQSTVLHRVGHNRRDPVHTFNKAQQRL